MYVNLMGTGLEGFYNVDISRKADKRVNLARRKIPLKDNSVKQLLCMSSLNYLTFERGQFIVNEVKRVLVPDGVCRFGVQDLELIATEYLNGNRDFQCERINRWFGHGDGYAASGQKCKYVYDYQTLAVLFLKAGFTEISHKLKFRERYKSTLHKYDNRPDQQFFIEGIKWKY